MTTAPIQLEYGQSARRRRLRLALAAALVVALLVGGRWAWPRVDGWLAWAGETRRMWQDTRRHARCMAFVAPAEQVVWDEDPSRTAATLKAAAAAADNRYVPVDLVDGRVAVAAATPEPWRRFWIDRWGRATPTAVGNPAVLFLHGRATPSGTRCLVVIEFALARSEHGPHLCATLVEAGSLRRNARHHGPFAVFEDADVCPSPRKRFFAGQPDPDDESHFTIDYEIDGTRGTLDGWLSDPPLGSASWEFASVRMSRRGPATQEMARPPMTPVRTQSATH
jgi:hypothetical protein